MQTGKRSSTWKKTDIFSPLIKSILLETDSKTKSGEDRRQRNLSYVLRASAPYIYVYVLPRNLYFSYSLPSVRSKV